MATPAARRSEKTYSLHSGPHCQKASSPARTTPKTQKAPSGSTSKESFERGADNVKRTGEDLDRFLTAHPKHERVLEEREDYLLYKEKVDRGETLTSAENARLQKISRNISNRKCVFKTKAERELRRGTRPPNELPITLPQDEEPSTSNTEIASPSFKARSQSSSSTFGESTPEPPQRFETPAGIPAFSEKQCLDDVEDEEESDDENIEDECSSEDEEDEETGECGQGEQFWRYSVYRSTGADFPGEEESTCIATCFSKKKAEATVREEILRVQAEASIQENKRVELRTVLEDNGCQSQEIHFASGRTVTVYMEKEVVEAAELTKKAQQNLSILPCRVYSVVERVLYPSDPHGRLAPPLYGECFVARQHANEDASRLLLSHVSVGLEDEERHDSAAIGKFETEQARYLEELEGRERLFDRRITLPLGSEEHGWKKQVITQVVEQLLRGPRNLIDDYMHAATSANSSGK
ncbi:hypothetical protein AJ79_05783 [Helicocarpus griseus UAMH5409]|uniref:Uncharacterized protein n=1 Tax=Helicocarpus griseus UAMH5409 TaxID=1447875 RepID=A0A2B7XBM5_9EURO|nr:hypothetical protein AJ79_05783 [Helicocarpus griseus UAMH5409]